MPIKPNEAGQPTPEEMAQLASTFIYIDKELKNNYQGKPHECTVDIEHGLPVRAIRQLAEEYKEAGWHVEDNYNDRGTLVFSED